MGYITTRLSGLGVTPERDVIPGIKSRRVSTVAKVFGEPTITMEETRRAIDQAVAADIPGASIAEKMLKPLEIIKKIQAEAPAVKVYLPAREPLPPVIVSPPLTTETESLPYARHSDQAIKPPVSRPVIPRIVNKPISETVVDTPPGTTPTITAKYVEPASLKQRLPSGGLPGTTMVKVKDVFEMGQPKRLKIVDPPPSVDVAPLIAPTEDIVLPTGQRFADLVQVEPLRIQTAEEAAAPTFLDVAGAPPWVMPALIGIGLYIFFGSAETAGRRPRRRRRRY